MRSIQVYRSTRIDPIPNFLRPLDIIKGNKHATLARTEGNAGPGVPGGAAPGGGRGGAGAQSGGVDGSVVRCGSNGGTSAVVCLGAVTGELR
ncbi:MAG: hypothetical protein WC262_12335 [Bacteroidales bacterium]